MVRTSEEFQVLRIINTPAGLSYEGTPVSMVGASITVMPLLTDVAEIPGESQIGWYDIQTGEIEALPAEETQALHTGDETQPVPTIDANWLARVLATYLQESAVRRLAQSVGSAAPSEDLRQDWLHQLVDKYAAQAKAYDLLVMALNAYQADVQEANQPEAS